MRAFVLYDKDGTITSAGIPAAADTGRQALLNQPGTAVTEVDLPDTSASGTRMTEQATGEDLTDKLTQVMADYRIEMSGNGPSLTRK
ncbi:hypothetical protein GCM10010329_77720 [Streptomyces spiroverticillatus]|uniref:Uncharacterized protein n=1 Tax=Streptomyces finlayi TaxID=67296 RepID=A0A918X5Y2_9ACTN|nr:hypothetical protein [Streptomyces finlayi]GHA43338.1 hypothetical protein GCM10010329_77720 [Streptomyces spiroverticillatus]GHD13441.1 hypothetical protein GCM10010334_71630 [Streptomyces finlayi]